MQQRKSIKCKKSLDSRVSFIQNQANERTLKKQKENIKQNLLANLIKRSNSPVENGAYALLESSGDYKINKIIGTRGNWQSDQTFAGKVA